MSDVLTDGRFGEIAAASLLAKFDGTPSEQLPAALKDLEVELIGLAICTPEEAEAATKKILALRFEKQYPPEVLGPILRKRAQETGRTFQH